VLSLTSSLARENSARGDCLRRGQRGRVIGDDSFAPFRGRPVSLSRCISASPDKSLNHRISKRAGWRTGHSLQTPVIDT